MPRVLDVLFTFFRLGCTLFGGPVAPLALANGTVVSLLGFLVVLER